MDIWQVAGTDDMHDLLVKKARLSRVENPNIK